MLAGSERLRTGLTLAAILLVTSGTQVLPKPPLPQVPVVTSVAAALPAAPFDARIQTSMERVRDSVLDGGDYAGIARSLLAQGRRMLHFDPLANRGRGAWAELVGTLDERTRAVGILVPGSGAFIDDENFTKYYQRGADLVDQSGGSLAVVVWAAGAFPKGWIQGSFSHYRGSLGRALALFSHELRSEIDRRLGPDAQVRVVVAGHSFGGAVVGAAERYGLDADAILHIASAGVGEVRDPYDYPEPQRPRYSITAPGDLIGFVQGIPGPPGMGHGPDPDTFRCVVALPTGDLPRNPTFRDELDQRLGDRAGARIGGVSSHSEVFIRYSDAWWQIYRVFMGYGPEPGTCSTPPDPAPPHVRVLPFAVPRVVTDSQCRAGGGLRPRDRHRFR
jgi:hypothetical protein